MPGGLARAEGRIPTIRGPVEVSFRDPPGSSFFLVLTLPPNMTARVELPVPEGARSLLMNDETLAVAVRDGYAVIDAVPSGQHRFSVLDEPAPDPPSE